jgi:hypothetical protein
MMEEGSLNIVAKSFGFDTAIELIEEFFLRRHETLTVIGEMLGISAKDVKRFMREHGITAEVRKGRPPAINVPDEDLCILKQHEIMAKYNISRATVWRQKRRLRDGHAGVPKPGDEDGGLSRKGRKPNLPSLGGSRRGRGGM